ncbi:hypothetical protein DACRYDRAFT_14144 [Dacryopinax primogenitus]|uniref:Uncharacterized protein n=1 Tax=Dacryopinax primogenitus (strain DJM 731) TaxID=1858805 RepID=M5G476_DACPD|nr:uncharacterized protein DACRYDRAFT_14144 [Dacryopinax primogenitus]EJU05066.1 hypothetical protein DACRYDRAFT_14144 [Dacryopinax primogenitus]
MDQAKHMANIKRMNKDLLDDWNHAVDRARATGSAIPQKPILPCTKVKEHVLPLDDCKVLLDDNPIVAYAKAYQEWCEPQKALPRILSMPSAMAKNKGKASWFGRVKSSDSFALSPSPLAITMTPRTTDSLSLPVNIIDVDKMRCLVHTSAHGLVIMPGPMNSFKCLVFLCPSDDAGFAMMHELPYKTKQTMIDMAKDLGRACYDEIEWELQILYNFDHPNTWTEKMENKISSIYWKAIFLVMCKDQLMDRANGIF